MSRQTQHIWDRERDQVNKIPDLIHINTDDHATQPPVVPVVSYGKSHDDSISSPQVSEGEPLGDDEPPYILIPPVPPPQQSS